MAVYKPDKITDKLLSYIRRRRYVEGDGDVMVQQAITGTSKESTFFAEVTKATSKKNAISYTTVVRDVAQAERQFSLLKSWITEVNHVHIDLEPALMPLLCHLYLDSLSLNPISSCEEFFERMSSSIISEDWYPFIKQLLSVHSLGDVEANPQISAFRDSKCELKMTPSSVGALRRFLASHHLHILIPALHNWFDITILTEDVVNEENDVDNVGEPARPRFQDGYAIQYVDKEMDELLNEINMKRLQPTPPPPLLLYTAHRTEGVVCGRVSIDGRLAATGDQRSEVRIWGLGETKITPYLHHNYFSSVPLAAFTEPFDDSQAQNEKQMWSLRGHSETVYDLAFIPETEYLISVSFDSTMRLWKLADFSCTAVYRGHSSPIWGVSVSPLSNYVATASQDKTARVWSLDRSFPVRIMAGHLQDVTCVRFHPNGTYLASGSPDRTVRLWSITDGNMVRVLGGLPGQGAVHALAFSPNGQYVASAGDDKYIWLWDLASGTVLYQLTGHSSRVVSLDWSNDGSTVSASTYDGCVLLWSLDSEKACRGQVEPKKYVTKCSTLLSLQYSTKNTLVAVGLK